MPTDWLTTPLGRRCLFNEQRVIRHALDRVFGEQLLQIGGWGAPEAFLRYARTQHSALVDWPGGAHGADIVSDPARLAVATDSVDAVLLPHTLEITESPHALLRETDRILRADGHLVTLCFAPAGAWGLRHLLSRDGYPQGHKRMIREGRLRDWLELLGFEVGPAVPYLHTLPFERIRRLAAFPRERWAQRWAPLLAGAYLLCAQTRVVRLTPIRPSWKRPRLRAVGGLVEPTTRSSRTRG
jgi:SAM-dependent methyltransferase